jgi:cell volume regulation protein A
MVEKIPNADMIFHIVFFITLTSLLLQGTTLFNIAKWLKLTIPEGKEKKPALEFESDTVKLILEELKVESNFNCANKAIVNIELPKTVLIVMIEREDTYLTPNGSTVIETGDRLTILADTKANMDTAFQVLKAY